MRWLAFTLAMLLILPGCRAMLGDFDKYGKNYSPIPLHRLSVGASKQAVEQELGPPVNVIGSKRYPEGVVEVWSYEKWHPGFGTDHVEERYWLYFFEKELVQWGRPGDWQREADRIHEIRIR